MARQENASYEGNGARKSTDVLEMMKKIDEISNEIEELRQSLEAYKSQTDEGLEGKLPIAGGTMTGALGLANGTWNHVGDDAWIGDANVAGCVAIKGQNGNTGIAFVPYSGSAIQTITTNGAGEMFVDSTVHVGYRGGVLVMETADTDPNSPEGGEIQFRGKDSTKGLTIDNCSGVFRVFGNLGGSGLVVYEFRSDGIYKNSIKIA